ncbi:aminotransferase class V-fold PLP-dependent enzyme, partial [bacterium]|nr:aminotransferase class V-fold PLP-dependent enzyme [bacterium]
SEAREKIGQFLGTARDNLVFVPNATHGINIVAHSLHLGKGDEILTTNHEYGAMDRTWRFLGRSSGATYRCHSVTLPVDNPDVLVDEFFAEVNDRTRVIFLSHISSPTAIRFPVREICRRARKLGILTIIDGAHAPGQIPLDLDDIQPDFYTGNFHKWLCAAKGSAFLYARPDVQPLIEPLVVSWGYEAETPGPSTFQDYLEWTGTQDFSAYLSVPAAIEFQEQNHWDSVQSDCHEMAADAWQHWSEISKLPQLYASDEWFAQMVTLPVPDNYPAAELKLRLMDDYKIEIPVIEWGNRLFLRLSVQAYNTQQDLDRLVQALEQLFGRNL